LTADLPPQLSVLGRTLQREPSAQHWNSKSLSGSNMLTNNDY